jgi:[ribosomal protein S5]-alanine N-acetyltransferase
MNSLCASIVPVRYAVYQRVCRQEGEGVPNTWETERLWLRLLGPAAAASGRDYGLRSASYHKPFDPARPADYWELPMVADRLFAQVAEAERDRSLCLFITLKSDPEVVIGAINLRNILRGALMGATLGYGLAPEAVGHGYMTEAAKRVVEIGFHDLGLHRVEVNIMPRNARSLAVAERTGFVREGLSPRYLHIAGTWEDHVRLARLSHNRER